MKLFLNFGLLFLTLNTYSQSDTTLYVYFKSGSSRATMTAQVFQKLDTAKWNRVVRLEAFTDSVGSIEFNQQLSEDRAAFVKSYLEQNTGFRVQKSVGKGELQKHTNLQQNRCVAIHFTRKKIPVVSSKNTTKAAIRTVFFDPKDTAIFVGKLSILHGIKFELNSSVVKPESYKQIDELVAFLNAYPSMKIQLRGHVCCQPAQSLSDNRAKKIADLLIKRGIAASRLTYKGFSNTIPSELTSDPMSEEQRRVEFEIVSF